MRATTVRDIQRNGMLDREPCRIEMAAGHTLVCVQGLAWLTVESHDVCRARRDIVLSAGERFAARRSLVAFVSALGSAPARIALHRYAAGIDEAASGDGLNAGRTDAASSSSMCAWGRP